MKEHDIWRELVPILRTNVKSIFQSLVLGLAASALTVFAEFVYGLRSFLIQGIWFKNLGLPVEWIGILRSSDAASLLDLRLLFYSQAFLQNLLFWAAISFSLIYIWKILRDGPALSLVPLYVLGLASARIQLELQMAVAAKGGFFSFARIDPFSFAQISAYFAMALLLFPTIITLVSRLPFLRFFKLSSLGLPIILMPPIVDYYILRQPVIYNFFTSELYQQARGPLEYLAVLSPGIKLEIVLIAASTFAYLVFRTRSVLRSAVTIMAVIFVFSMVSTPALASRLHLGFSQPQLFAGYLLITYLLIIVDLGLAQRNMTPTILRRVRLRGIHFPAMMLFGSFFVHPAILATGIPEDFGLIIAGAVIVFLVWQTATVFDDLYDRGQTELKQVYLAYGILIAAMAILSALPFGLIPWLLTLLAVYLAADYPRIRRKHYLWSGMIIGIASSAAFLFGVLLPIVSPASVQLVQAVALLIFAVFSGGSLLKDITNIEEDKQLRIPTVFTQFETKKVLPVVASFVAVGVALPAVFLRTLLDLVVFLGLGCVTWLLIVLAKDRSYKPVLILYFLEGIWIFYRMFVNTSG
jgi:4-hydroxybenzoate polyprenyltransferase